MANIGFIGLGNMGSAMCRRLLEAGHDITVFNRTREKAERMRTHGARVADSPRALSESEIVITMLADDEAVLAVTYGANGFAAALPKGATHICSSTIGLGLSRRLQADANAASKRYVAAPVLGRPDAAAAGELFVLAAGDTSDATDAIFATLGQRTFVLGTEGWRAHMTKLAINFMLASAIETMGEAFVLVKKAGVDAAAFHEIFSSTLFNAPIYKNYGNMIARSQYTADAGFKLPLAAKDLRLARAAAEEFGVPLPIGDLISAQLADAIARGMAELDWAALGKLAADNACT